MRAGPNSPPVIAAPVGEVVSAGLIRGAGPVADLVPGQAGFGDQLVGEFILVGVVVVVDSGDFTAADLRGELGAVLHDQRVGADVVRLVGQSGLERVTPVGEGLPRCPV